MNAERRRLVEVAGTKLDTLFVGGANAAGGPLVFLHEGLGSIELWRGFPEQVRAAVGDPAMLVYSRRGYGNSGPADLPRPVTYMHEEADVVLPALLERFGIESPVLVGHSDGASIALLHAGAGSPVRALALLAPHVFVEDVSVEAIAAARQAYATTDLRARLARYHDDPDAAFRGWNEVWLSEPFRSWNIEDRLPTVTCPVLLVQGDADAYGTAAQLDAIEAGVRGPVRRVLLPGVGHSPHLEAPEPTLTAIAELLTDT